MKFGFEQIKTYSKSREKVPDSLIQDLLFDVISLLINQKVFFKNIVGWTSFLKTQPYMITAKTYID